MQQGLIQALMTVLPGVAASMPSSVLKVDGQVDFAGFLQSMAPALEQQLAQMPSDVRASLLAELGHEILDAQAIADVTGPKGKALDAMLGDLGSGDAGEGQEDAPSTLDQLFAMLGMPPVATVTPQVAVPDVMTPVVQGDETPVAEQPGAGGTPAILLPAGMSLPSTSGEAMPRQGGVAMDVQALGEGRRRAFPHEGVMPPSAQGDPEAHRVAEPAGVRGEGDASATGGGTASPLPSLGVVAQMLREAGDASRSVDAGGIALAAGGETTTAQPVISGGEGLRPRFGQELQTLDRIQVPLHQTRDFGEAVGQRVMLMVGREMQGARIELNPVDLGPMEINLQLRGNEATVHFGAAHTLTREAIEAAIPRLRDLLAEQGFTQVNVNVGQQQQQGQGAQNQNMGGQGHMSGQGASGLPGSANGDGSEELAHGARSVGMLIRASGVDLFV